MLDFRVSMDGKVASEIISNIDEIIKHSKQMQRYRLFIDGENLLKSFGKLEIKYLKKLKIFLKN